MISLIIPVYNVEPYLRKCLDSLLAQDYDDWEALIVEDGSTDGSGAICDEYATRDSRLRVFHKMNEGVSAARNFGLDNARGEWIWFVDSDDWISEDALDRLGETIRDVNCDTIFFGIEYYDEQNNLIGQEDRNSAVDLPKDKTIINEDYPPQNYLLKREIVESNRLRFTPATPTGEDLEFQYKYLMLCHRPVAIEHRLYNCLRREGSAMRNPKTLENIAKCSPAILSRLVDFIIANNITESDWLASRLCRSFKSAMSSNYLVKGYRKGLQQRLRDADHRLKSAGFRKYSDAAVKIGVHNLRAYFLFQYFRSLLKR